jgi:4-oxalocrotonate tautomerase
MPLLSVRMIEGVFTPTQKQEMIRKLTDTMVSIEGENLRPYTLVVLDEVKSGDWGVAVFTYPLTVQLIQLRQPLGAFQFAIIGPSGTYTVLGSTDLVARSELGVATNSLGAVIFTDVAARLSPRKFYRARLSN